MDDSDKINPLNAEDRELLSDLTSIFDLGHKLLLKEMKKRSSFRFNVRSK